MFRVPCRVFYDCGRVAKWLPARRSFSVGGGNGLQPRHAAGQFRDKNLVR
jgi:hypothetical protein